MQYNYAGRAKAYLAIGLRWMIYGKKRVADAIWVYAYLLKTHGQKANIPRWRLRRCFAGYTRNGLGGNGVYLFETIKDRIEFLFDTNHAKYVTKREWDEYEEINKAYIPIGGISEKWIVDERAGKSKERRILMLRYDIRNLECSINSKQNRLESRKKELSAIKDGTMVHRNEKDCSTCICGLFEEDCPVPFGVLGQLSSAGYFYCPFWIEYTFLSKAEKYKQKK